MKCVEILEEIKGDMSGLSVDPASRQMYAVVAPYTTVPEALQAIEDGTHGDGPFTVATIHRRGVGLDTVTTKVLNPGTAYGAERTTTTGDE